MARKLLLALPAAAALLGGCVILPTYAPAAGEPVAIIQADRLPSPSFCADGVGYDAKVAKDGTIQVPANKRISLYSYVVRADYNVTYTCVPGASYTFEPGRRYVGAVQDVTGGCAIDLVQLSDTTDTGLAPEPSQSGPHCNPWAKPPKPKK
ncbi:hypothetical protein [Arenimonas sp. MALMAid1274]|uniref:hypothetical protein n=1 Tax=Arenimonas sp. MALMAid1274 TaxID=3411630 RepID=UPI003B9DE3FC